MNTPECEVIPASEIETDRKYRDRVEALDIDDSILGVVAKNKKKKTKTKAPKGNAPHIDTSDSQSAFLEDDSETLQDHSDQMKEQTEKRSKRGTKAKKAQEEGGGEEEEEGEGEGEGKEQEQEEQETTKAIAEKKTIKNKKKKNTLSSVAVVDSSSILSLVGNSLEGQIGKTTNTKKKKKESVQPEESIPKESSKRKRERSFDIDPLSSFSGTEVGPPPKKKKKIV